MNAEVRSSQWERFDNEIGLYKTHLDVVIKAALFVFAITGGVASFVLKEIQPMTLAKLTLLVPVVLNTGFAVIFGMSISRSLKMTKAHRNTCLGLEIDHFDMGPLTGVCVVLFLMCATVGVGLLCFVVVDLPLD